MSNLCLRQYIVVKGKLEEKSEDLKRILHMQAMAEKIFNMASDYTLENFDITDEEDTKEERKEGIKIVIKYDSDKVWEKANKLKELMEEVQRTSSEIYKMVGVVAETPVGITNEVFLDGKKHEEEDELGLTAKGHIACQ